MRHYNEELPYTISSFWVGMFLEKVQPFMHRLPVALALKLQSESTREDGIEITKEDLDSIPDALWEEISKEFNL